MGKIESAGDKPSKSKYKKKRQFCTECDKSFSKREYLSKHMRVEHNLELEKIRPGRIALILKTPTGENDPRPYKCDQCEKEYIKSKHLSRHRLTHLQQYCNECKVPITTNYADHMLKVHNYEVPRPFECPHEECKKTFRTRANLSAHMRIHRAENRTYKCAVPMCLKSFFFSTDLRKHMKSHSQERSVICDICGDALKTSDTLKSHMRIHTGDKPHKCRHPGCPKAFATSNSLDIHIRTHTGEKPFKCDADGCQKSFSDPSTLQVHKRLHTNESPFQCHLCDRRTRQASNLRSHYKHFHKNNDITSRQIRRNSRIFGRYSQQEIEQHLREYGDLMVLLEKGLTEYDREQNEKNIEIAKALRLAAASMSRTTSAIKNPTKQLKLVTSRENETFAIPTFAEDAEEATVKEGGTMKIKPCSIILVNCIRTEEEEPIKHENPTNGESIHQTVDNTEMKPQSAVKKTVRHSEGSEVGSRQRRSQEKVSGRCTRCKKSFHHLLKHIAETHSDLERPFECFICQRTYKRLEHLKYHMVTHGDTRDYVCHHCGQAYFLNSDLRKHIFNRHQNNRPFACRNCGKAFKCRRGLRVHERTHENLKPFSCNICQAVSFSTLGALKIHERKHTGERPFQCNHCGKQFSDSSILRQHVRIHTGDKPYKCLLCDRRTAQAGNLKSHYRHYHKLIVKHVTMFHEKDHRSTLTDPSNMIPLTIANK